MAFNFKVFWQGLRIKPKTASTADSKGDLEVIDSTGKLNYHNGTTVSPVVTEAHPATLTNKAIDADNNTISELEVDNLKAGVLNIDDALAGATNDQIPSALAVKTFVEDSTSAVQSDVDALILLSGVPEGNTDLGTFTGSVIPDNSTIKDAFQATEDAIEMVAADLGAHILDPSDAHDASAISVAPISGLSATDGQGAFAEHQGNIDALITLSGVGENQTDLGTFTGVTIPDGSDIKEALQALETGLETGDAAKVTGPASATDNAAVRFDGTTGKLVQNSGVIISDLDAVTGVTALTVDTISLDGLTIATTGDMNIQTGGLNNINLKNSTILESGKFFAATHSDNTATGANATLTINGKNLRLTNSGLTSIDMMVADAFGKEVTLINRTGNEITINNDTGGTAAYRIYTGTGAAVTLPVDGAFSFVYDGSTQRWNLIGGTGSGEGGGTTDVDVLSVDTYDSATTADYTQTGLTFNTVTPIHGTQSAQLIHQAGSSQSYKKTIAVDRKFRGQLCELSLNVRSTATDGNVTLLVTDETNAVTIAASQSVQTSSVSIASLTITNGVAVIGGFSNVDINSLEVGMAVTGTGIQTNTVINSINTSTNSVVISQTATSTTTTSLRFSAVPTTRTFSFEMPSDCASFSYTITALQESGSPQTTIDDAVVKLASVSLLETSVEVPVVTEWQAYTPTLTGFGTTSNVEFEWRQVAENVEIRGKFTAGTSTAVEARVSLPNGYTTAGTSLIPSTQKTGSYTNGGSATSTAKGGHILIQPSVTYFNFSSAGVDGTASVDPNALGLGNNAASNNGVILISDVSIPISGLSATETVAIPLTQSGLIQQADSSLRIQQAAGNGSTNTFIRRFTNIIENIGTGFTYIPSATLGDSITVSESGIYDIVYTDNFNGAGATFAIVKNYSTNVTPSSVPIANRLATNFSENTADFADSVPYSGYFNAGDVIRFYTSTNTVGTNVAQSQVTISKQGSLKQVSVSSDQKIKIPTSELRFEGASARGAVATAIVKFDTQAKIRGDAFTVTNTTNDGTYVTMTKAGKLNVDCSLVFGATNTLSISLNQQTLTSSPIASELLNSASSSASPFHNSVNATVFVKVGDVIRISANQTPSSNTVNNLVLSFEEQDISVSVTNTLPQFSESDTVLNAAGNAGQAITASVTNVPFITITDTSGSWNGSQYTVQEDGVYNISGSVFFTTSVQTRIYLYVDGVQYRCVSTNAASTDSTLPFFQEAKFTKGQVLSLRVANAATLSNSTGFHYLNITKVGKPNVTGVDVTPFVNIPQPLVQNLILNRTSAVAVGTDLSTIVVSNTNNGLFSLSASGLTALKPIKINASMFATGTSNAAGQAFTSEIYKSGTLRARGSFRSVDAGTLTSNAAFDGDLQVGETLTFAGTGPITTTQVGITVTAEALSDQILTAPQTFSTDTAGLVYAGSATYTPSTLTNAPVGTFITHTYAASGNVRTQTTTAPTQTTSDMNTNGILVYGRAFNATSTAAQPAVVQIQIGKGLKGVTPDCYTAAAKTAEGAYTYQQGSTNATEFGTKITYSEKTGILTLDAGYVPSTAVNSKFVAADMATNNGVTSAYFVVNASTNPALTGMNIGKVMARGVNTAGTSIATTATTIPFDSTKTYDTHGALNAATGTFTCPETGYYQVNAGIVLGSDTYTINQAVILNIMKNGVLHTSGLAVAQTTSSIALSVNISDVVYLTKNDTLLIQANGDSGPTALSTGAGRNYLSIAKVSN